MGLAFGSAIIVLLFSGAASISGLDFMDEGESTNPRLYFTDKGGDSLWLSFSSRSSNDRVLIALVLPKKNI